ncbi:hypothetical protein [Mergibacter septicus]|uniref:hypothetical protein n=1 Tax=Mergibacter septicus TaxID=221402 RepID=UPI00223FC99E|nr:hypothetical protein [Mergibacter septicus]
MFSKIKYKLLNLLKLIHKPKKKYRPHYYSKNAWSYVKNGKPTPALALLLKMGVKNEIK